MRENQILELLRTAQNNILRSAGMARNYEAEIAASISSKPIKIISGFRRSGKSFLVRRLAKKLIDKKVFDIDDIFYINFEDYQSSQLVRTVDDLNNAWEIFLAKSNQKTRKLLILDEIQIIPQWDKLLRSIYEANDQNQIEIIITGSNSDMLSSELGSNLAGRFIEFRILPFSFSEYLRFLNFEISNEDQFFRYYKEISQCFSSYIEYGGLPEIFSINLDSGKTSYLQGIVSKVMLDDVIERFNVKNSKLLENILSYIVSNCAAKSSYSTILKHIKNQKLNIDDETLMNYIDYFVKSFILWELPKFDWKLHRVFSTSKKFCVIDPGIVNLYKPLVHNFSRQLENLVYLELMRRHPQENIYYGTEPNITEIDFLVQEKRRNKFTKYQVTQELNDENYERELAAFAIADKYIRDGKNILLVFDYKDQREKICYKDVEIQKTSLLRWLLGDELDD